MNVRRLVYSGALTAGAIALAVVSPAFAAPLLMNGSFENGTVTDPFTTVHAGNTNITDWSVVSGDVDYISTYWTASNGSRSIDMTGDMPGAIQQTLATTPGVPYTVTFDLSGNPVCGPSTKMLNVDTGGSPTLYQYDTAVNGTTLNNMNWLPQTYSFTANSTATPLTFTSLTPGYCGPALDNVQVQEVFPTTKDQCKNDGWKQYGVFKNQGDCVSYVATHGNNPPAYSQPLTF